ncbi:MAG: hypothetical protein JWM95_4271 [Gemmatimonadetes bacterium]|nr:hypothetical protein [Gemmatimonadota bacterium]
MSQSIPYADSLDRATVRQVEVLADRVASGQRDHLHFSEKLALAANALNTLDVNASELLEEADAFRPRTVVVVVLGCCVLLLDQQQLSAFAKLVASLSGASDPSLFWIASIVSLVLIASDFGVGMLFSRRDLSLAASVLRASVIGTLLAVPTVITLATCLARWTDDAGMLPKEKMWVTIAMVGLTFAAHAVIIALAASGVGPWVYYRVARFFAQRRVQVYSDAVFVSQKAIDRAMIRFELGVTEPVRSELRALIMDGQYQSAAGNRENGVKGVRAPGVGTTSGGAS